MRKVQAPRPQGSPPRSHGKVPRARGSTIPTARQSAPFARQREFATSVSASAHPTAYVWFGRTGGADAFARLARGFEHIPEVPELGNEVVGDGGHARFLRERVEQVYGRDDPGADFGGQVQQIGVARDEVLRLAGAGQLQEGLIERVATDQRRGWRLGNPHRFTPGQIGQKFLLLGG